MRKIQALSFYAAALAVSLSGCSHAPVVPKASAPAQAPAAAPQPVPAHGLDFASFDLNHDGKVSREEYRARIPRKFQLLDRDQSGMLELKREHGGRWSRTSDHNRDGRVSIVEFMRDAARAFERADRDQSGALTPAEFETLELY